MERYWASLSWAHDNPSFWNPIFTFLWGITLRFDVGAASKSLNPITLIKIYPVHSHVLDRVRATIKARKQFCKILPEKKATKLDNIKLCETL